MKTVHDLHRFRTSMSAIFGFTFHIGRMTEVLIPDIYIYRERERELFSGSGNKI